VEVVNAALMIENLELKNSFVTRISSTSGEEEKVPKKIYFLVEKIGAFLELSIATGTGGLKDQKKIDQIFKKILESSVVVLLNFIGTKIIMSKLLFFNILVIIFLLISCVKGLVRLQTETRNTRPPVSNLIM
jgi:hypothetical protein